MLVGVVLVVVGVVEVVVAVVLVVVGVVDVVVAVVLVLVGVVLVVVGVVEVGAGLHWSFPYPIDEVVRIPYSEIQQVKSTVGWYFTTPEQEALETINNQNPGGPSLNPAVDGYVIAGDGNIIHTRATLYYRIEDSIHYKFDFVDASNAVQNALDNALIYAASRFNVDDILTSEIARFQETVRARVTKLVEAQNLGIVIEHCEVQSRPPRQLKTAFDAVLTAVSARDKMLNDALSDQNRITNRAAADATGIINAAQRARDCAG